MDVYVISTGAMISSGFFLLPGLAASHTGRGIVLAYLLAGLLIVPALLSQAELATAMPRAGGPYYYLDRTLGPLVGTVGGVSTWLTLVLKSAFALIGMGAYVGLAIDVPILPTALAFTLLFAIVNLVGTRESSRFLRFSVVTLLAVLFLFVVHGLVDIAKMPERLPAKDGPFLAQGLDGLLATVGLLFISFIGLTKIASLAEEIKDPERNIPLGMMLALVTVTAVYVGGVYIMLTVLGPDALSRSLTPVADAAAKLSAWIPSHIGVGIMIGAAILAFSSMANAGILAASRYPLAMARDRLIPERLALLSPLGTPVASIALTSSTLALSLILLDVEQVAKLASAMQLLLFGLINVAVIVMRESRIESYDPGFRSPLYPWVQLAGVFIPLVLVAEMGWLPVLFTLGVTAACFGWYNSYARHHIGRDGAIFHVFERLGRRRFAGLDRELRDIMKEKGLRAGDPFDAVVARAGVIDLADAVSIDSLVTRASSVLAGRLPVTQAQLDEALLRNLRHGGTPAAHGAALLHARLPDYDGSELVVVRAPDGVGVDPFEDLRRESATEPLRAVFFLVSGERDPGRHLRILAQLAGRVEYEGFMLEWLQAKGEQELKEVLLRDDRFLSLYVLRDESSRVLIGRSLRELDMPEGSLVALIWRGGESIVPRGGTVLHDGDRLTIIGEPHGLRKLALRFGPPAR
ncbi:MAG TPA: amino acid permease [Gammaproteobacteria bacterium]